MNAESTHPGEMEIDQLESSPAPTQIIETSQQQREREKQQLREERKSRKASEKKRKETATLSSILEDIPGAMRSGEFEGGLGEPLKKKHKKKKDVRFSSLFLLLILPANPSSSYSAFPLTRLYPMRLLQQLKSPLK